MILAHEVSHSAAVVAAEIDDGERAIFKGVPKSILTIVYHTLTEGTVYQDLAPQYFDERDRQRVERRLVHRLEALGYTVALEPAAA